MRPTIAISIFRNASNVNIFQRSQSYMIWVTRMIRRHPKTFTLSCGLLTIIYKISKALLVPYQLWHIPRVNTIDWFWSSMKGESADVRSERLLMPLMNEHGLCTKYMMGRWTVTIGDPILLQQMLKDSKTFPKEVNASLDPVSFFYQV